ncbi:MAG: cell division protein ZapA [Flavobacteriales bacterium]|jgi:cell division protein ZapA|nr:cell division protein ZapA [Bacteroidota bacterium]MDP4953475.1 cell division protein ZapA [Flavobacteriales bacterium]
MSDLSIKLNIAGRMYPLTIRREEEESIRLAARKIEEAIKAFEENYAVRDKQDLLAMTALQLATQSMKQGNKKEDDESENALRDIQAQLQKVLNESNS